MAVLEHKGRVMMVGQVIMAILLFIMVEVEVVVHLLTEVMDTRMEVMEAMAPHG